MGLISTLISGGARLLGLGGRAGGRALQAGRRFAGTTGGRAALGLTGAVAGGAAFEAGTGFFDGGGAPLGSGAPGTFQTPQIASFIDAGAIPTALSNGRVMLTMPNGDVQIFSRNGMPVRPTIIIPAGQRLPGGAVVVSTRNGGALIGLTVRRRRRQFATEARKVRNVLSICKSIERAAAPRKRRA